MHWEVNIRPTGGIDYKINNNHRAFIARWLLRCNPCLTPYLKIRERSRVPQDYEKK